MGLVSTSDSDKTSYLTANWCVIPAGPSLRESKANYIGTLQRTRAKVNCNGPIEVVQAQLKPNHLKTSAISLHWFSPSKWSQIDM